MSNIKSHFFKLVPPELERAEAIKWIPNTILNFNHKWQWYLMGNPSIVAFEDEHNREDLLELHRTTETGKLWNDIIAIDDDDIYREIKSAQVPFMHHIVYNPRLKGKKKFDLIMKTKKTNTT